MEDSILNSTKKILGMSEEYSAFDLDIITHLNSVFSILTQLGISLPDSYYIEDEEATWSDLDLVQHQLNLVRTYVFLKVRLLFDPPTTSFHIEAAKSQIEEHEWRLNHARELALSEEVAP